MQTTYRLSCMSNTDVPLATSVLMHARVIYNNVYLRGSTLFDASEADIRKGNTGQHLVETVCHPIAIPFPYGLVEQIGGEYRKQPVVIPVFQQFYDRRIDIAILLHLYWLQSEIVYRQQSCTLQLVELVFIIREVQYLYGFIDSEEGFCRMSVRISILWILLLATRNQGLDGGKCRGFAVARITCHQQTYSLVWVL